MSVESHGNRRGQVHPVGTDRQRPDAVDALFRPTPLAQGVDVGRLLASSANSEPTPGPVFDEASFGMAKGDAEHRRWRPGRRLAENGPPVRVARETRDGLICQMVKPHPRNRVRPTAYRSLARQHSGLPGTYVCTHQGARNTSTSRRQQGVGLLFAPATTGTFGGAAEPRTVGGGDEAFRVTLPGLIFAAKSVSLSGKKWGSSG